MDVTIALLGLGGAILGAFLTAVLQPFLTKWISPTAELTLSIKHNSFHIPELINSSIEEFLYSPPKGYKLKDEFRKILNDTIRSKGVCEIIIHNRSSKSINSVSFTLKSQIEFIYEIQKDGKSSKATASNNCDIGTIRANSTCLVRLWTHSDYGEGFFYKKDDFINLTAEEIDKIEINDRIPLYISDSYNFVSKSIINRIFNYTLVAISFISFAIPFTIFIISK